MDKKAPWFMNCLNKFQGLKRNNISEKLDKKILSFIVK